MNIRKSQKDMLPRNDIMQTHQILETKNTPGYLPCLSLRSLPQPSRLVNALGMFEGCICRSSNLESDTRVRCCWSPCSEALHTSCLGDLLAMCGRSKKQGYKVTEASQIASDHIKKRLSFRGLTAAESERQPLIFHPPIGPWNCLGMANFNHLNGLNWLKI